ncbi:DUF4328 domain-containing protein [Streptomyces sp. NPDC048664]|uniref:DUF4328 domain-containing protein n=1 Tax=Streptomyces sp. NPDC048664 TaxID=3154505 RepID=UPI00344268D2
MICARCDHYAAKPDDTLCAQCAVAPAPSDPPPPAAVPYVPPAPTAWLRSPVGLGRAAAAALGLVVAADLAAVWSDLVSIDVTDDLMKGVAGTDMVRRAERADTLSGVAGLAQVATLVAAIAVYLCWFYRVRVNAEVFDQSAHSKARGWAIGGWFVPVANLWFPRRVTLDIWDASTPWGRRPSHALVNAWWGLWILSLAADRAAFTADRHAKTPSELHHAAGTMLFSDSVDIVSALLAIALVLRLTRMQHQKALAGPLPE